MFPYKSICPGKFHYFGQIKKSKTNFVMKRAFLLFLLCQSVFCIAQTEKTNKSQLTIESIMRDPDKWIGVSPSGIIWSEDSKTIYFNWNPEKDTLPSLHSWQAKSGEIRKITAEEKKLLPGHDGEYNSDYTQKVFIRNGNLFLLNLKKGTEQQLTGLMGSCSDPHFINKGKFISFVYNQNLCLLTPETGFIRQLTNFVAGEERPEKDQKGQAAWLKNQQKGLFEVLKDRELLSKTREYHRNLEKPDEPVKVYTGNAFLMNISLSQSGRFVIFSLSERGQDGAETNIPQFVTSSGYTEERRSRSKVGGQQGTVTMGIIDLERNKSRIIKTDSLPGIKEVPAFHKDYPITNSRSESIKAGRKVNLQGPFWHETEDKAIVVALSQDNKDRWVLLLDPQTGKLEMLDRQHDEAWIGGPGVSGWSYSSGSIGWMPDGNTVWFQSEESGYAHLYTVNCTTKQKNTLTSGKFEVYEPFISRDKKYFYFGANIDHPGVRHFYKMPVSGGIFEKLTQLEGSNEVTLSPDEKTMAILFSTANKPWELYIQENKQGAVPVKITDSVSDEFKKYPWRVPEFITFSSDDNAEVHARLYRPVKSEPDGPAVIFVHGAGYLQNAHKWWSSYSREYFFNNLLADNGYTVLDIDYRGSAGYGRDWRTAIYRHMGGKDLIDHVYGARYLTEKCSVDPNRIGLYGGSYGGFITLMGMFLYPEVFKAGAALRSVTDWAHYNHGYTSDILNTPVTDSLAYVKSSPVYFANGLKGALLMCHGMVDDNVHFQDIVRLTQRLIELGKENWELAVYPVESHGFTEPSSWTDEYKRIYKLFEENLKK
jgi:dipeptidyl aminopeptidase/acylaminoacyl peptidase